MENKNTIILAGKEFPAVFNMNALANFENKYGSIENWESSITGDKPFNVIRYTATVLVNQGLTVANILEEKNEQLITEEYLGALLTQKNMESTLEKIFKVVADGMGDPDPNE